MILPYTITAAEMRSINQSAILEIIRRESPISRSAIAERLDVSLPTVMRIVDELIQDDLVSPQSDTEWSGGRPRALLEFNAASQVVLGVDLGGTKMYGAVTDLGGDILHEAYQAYPGGSSDDNYASLVHLLDQLLEHAQKSKRRIRGIGVGAPGVTRHREGIVQWAPSLNWRNYALKDKLVARYNLPVSVDNDVNLAALGELWFGAGRNTSNMVLITIGTGIGAGIIIDGAIYRGAHQSSGEIGYFLPGRQFLGKNYDAFGALESQASGNGIADRARRARPAHLTEEALAQLTAEDIFEAMRLGEEWTEPIIEDTVDYLAIAVAGVSALLDPEVIVLGGMVTGSAAMLLKKIHERIDEALPNIPDLAVSPLGRRATVLGTITHVLHNTANFYIVRKLS